MNIRFLTILTLFVALLTAPAVYGGCQGQTCEYSQGCYRCEDQTGWGCSTNGCNSCTESVCSGGGGGGIFGQELNQDVDDQKLISGCIEKALRNQAPTPGSNGLILDLWLPSQDVPALLHKAHFGNPTGDIFEGGEVINLTEKEIVSYRIGWTVFRGSEAPETFIGSQTSVTGSESSKSYLLNVPSQVGDDSLMNTVAASITKQDGLEAIHRITFFLAEVELGNGESWQANPAVLFTK